MIRVNLLKNPLTGGTAQLGVSLDGGEEGLGDSKNQAIKNLFIIILGAAGLFVYEQVTIPGLRTQYSQLQREVSELQTKNNQAQEAVAKIENLKKQQDTIEKQIGALGELQKNRTREIRFLDHLQAVAPERLWLNRIQVQNDSVLLTGLAAADEEITRFMDALGQSPLLRNTGLVRSSEFTSPQFRGVKQFEIRTTYVQ